MIHWSYHTTDGHHDGLNGYYTQPVSAGRDALSKQHHRRGVVFDRAFVAQAEFDWPAAQDESSVDRRGNPLHGDDRLPLAPDAQGVSTLFDGSMLFLPLGSIRNVVED